MARTWFDSAHPFRSALLSFLFIAACLAGCSSNDTEQCNISTPPATADGDGTVTYTASITGDALINTVIYRTQDGPKTVDQPTLPFQVDVMVQNGLGIGITATGSTKDGGNVLVGSSFVDSAGSAPVVSSARCH